MVTYTPEPPHAASDRSPVGILLCNLGTPDAPTPEAVRPYLAEFLSDPRVIEQPAWKWLPILHGVVLRRRPARVAEKYKLIWTDEGSPLAVWSARQARALQARLREGGAEAVVGWAMRYGQPAIATELDALKAAGCTRILILPLYPQYAACTTGSVMDDVAAWIRQTRKLPELRYVRDFCEDEGYLRAMVARVEAVWHEGGRPDCLLMSFHGLPKEMIDLGDSYQSECERTAKALAARLQLEDDQWQICYQSRFGRAKWIGPATDETLEQLPVRGVRRVDVICPGFVSDCLETLEEIALDGKQDFMSAGGEAFRYIPCVNAEPLWIETLVELVQRHASGWFA